MPQLFVTTRNGETRTLDAPQGVSIMEAIRDSGIDELLALCGGGCACATCHVYVDPEFADLIPPISDDEIELLEGSGHRNERSRLGCQIRLKDEHSGLRLTVAPEE